MKNRRNGGDGNLEERVSYQVPENPFGITAMHSRDGPIALSELEGFFSGPMRRVHALVVADCAVVVGPTPDDCR